MDKISAILRKQQLLNYPDGQHVQGVRHEYVLHHENKPDPVSGTLINI